MRADQSLSKARVAGTTARPIHPGRRPAIMEKPMRIALVCVLVSALSPVLDAQRPAQNAADEQAVRTVVTRYVAAREARDAAAVAALFTADADQYTTAGEWRRGRDQIRSGTAESSQRNPGSRQIAVEAVRFITPDVAIADGPYQIASGGSAATRRMWTTLVLVRTAEGWRISAIRNMAPTGGQ
jgi:uncharacterized protein (TIGR02246 family)